jgi:hypothetical protein
MSLSNRAQDEVGILDADCAAAGATVTADLSAAFLSRRRQMLIAVEPEGEADQDRRQGHQHGRSVAFQIAVIISIPQVSGDFAANC